jgi:putative Mg2+ transporter-C (MgtC) family protein
MIEYGLSIEPFKWIEIGTALLCSFVIGLERQLRGKPVGIRTSALITLGTYMFVVLAASVSNSATDPSRAIGQVITGVGFLGAGVMLTRNGVVVGVTSAATIWALASLGVCVATGHYLTAVKLAVIIIAVLVGVETLEKYFHSLTRGVHKKYRGWRGKDMGQQ